MRKIILAVLFLAIGPLLVAQQALNNDSIIKLVKAGMSEDAIVSTINTSPGTYDTSADGLAALKTAGASDKVVASIVAKANAPTPAPAPVVAAQAPLVPAPSPGAAPVPPGAGPQIRLSLCEFHLDGTSKADNNAAFAGGGLIPALIAHANSKARSYYPDISKDVQHVYESAFMESGIIQYVNSEKPADPAGETLTSSADITAKNPPPICVNAKPYWEARGGYHMKPSIFTIWKVEGPGGCKFKFKTSATSSDKTSERIPNGADPALKPVYLELSKEDAKKFLEEFPKEMEKAGCGK